MFAVYILKDKNGRLYKGVTSNLKRRFKEHLKGETKTTRSMIDIKIIYKEEYNDFETARKREVYLKTSAGRRFLKNKLK